MTIVRQPAPPLAAFTMASPIGPLTLVACEAGLTHLEFGQRDHPVAVQTPARARAILDRARRQLEAYFAGQRRAFDLPLAPSGTPFQLAAWEVLRAIPYGETISYGEQARRLGRPAAARAVGAANGANPISIVVPCHRVVGADGRLVGFGGGLDVKRYLLNLEVSRSMDRAGG